MTTSAELLDRLALMQQECVPYADAPYGAFQTQEGYPYWTNRVSRVQVAHETSDMQGRTYYVRMRLVLGNLTADYDGVQERRAADALDSVLAFFAARRTLVCTAAPARLNSFDPIGADITDAAINYGALNTGSGSAQIMIDFTIECPFQVSVPVIYP